MGGRSMPIECEHGLYLDWGGFADDWSPYDGLCPTCMSAEECERMNVEHRLMNEHRLGEFHREWYATDHGRPA